MHVTINGIDTRYVLDQEGNNPWLTFIHPLGADLSLWDQFAGYFRGAYSVLRYDVRGHGHTACAHAPFSIADLADDLAALLDALGAPSTHLVGVSMGGMIAQSFALEHPQRIRSLTLADTTRGYDAAGVAQLRERAAAVRREGVGPLVDATMARWFTEKFRLAHPEVIEVIADVLRNAQPEGYSHACNAIATFDSRARVHNVACPTLVMAGEHDTGTPVAENRSIAEAISGARFVALDAAHLAPIEQGARFAALLESFLKEAV